MHLYVYIYRSVCVVCVLWLCTHMLYIYIYIYALLYSVYGIRLISCANATRRTLTFPGLPTAKSTKPLRRKAWHFEMDDDIMSDIAPHISIYNHYIYIYICIICIISCVCIYIPYIYIWRKVNWRSIDHVDGHNDKDEDDKWSINDDTETEQKPWQVH